MMSWSLNENVIVGAGGAHFDFQNSSHLQPLAATCLVSHLQPLAATCTHLHPLAPTWQPLAATCCHLLQPLEQVSAKWLQVAASGCKWLTGQVAASGCKWLQVAASG